MGLTFLCRQKWNNLLSISTIYTLALSRYITYTYQLRSCGQNELKLCLLFKIEMDRAVWNKNQQAGADLYGPAPSLAYGNGNVTYRQQTTDKKVNTEPL